MPVPPNSDNTRTAVCARTRWSHRRRRSWGGAVLETILILPFLLLVVFGGVEYGYYFWVKHTLEGAGRDGCRVFIMANATVPDVQTAVDNAMRAAGLQNASYTVYVGDGTPPAWPALPPQVTAANQATCASGDTISVYVWCTWGTVGQGMRPMGLIGATKTVYGQATMRKEG